MTGQLHLALGIFTGACGAHFLKQTGADRAETICFAAPVILGSVFPDIDILMAMSMRHFHVTDETAWMLFGHRGILHTPFFYSIVFILMAVLMKKYRAAFAFTVGTCMHMAQDIVTQYGIMLFFPLSGKYIGLTPYNSKHPAHLLITACFMAVMWKILPGLMRLGRFLPTK